MLAGMELSRPARGAWVEIVLLPLELCSIWSRPARGAWVEIGKKSHRQQTVKRRAPQGARGLKCSLIEYEFIHRKGRAPQGARGLKFSQYSRVLQLQQVAPRKGRVG